MEPLKDIRWRQRFENYEKSYKLLEKYSRQNIQTELERAGIIQFFEITFELAWKVLKDYMESEGYIVKSPREAITEETLYDLNDLLNELYPLPYYFDLLYYEEINNEKLKKHIETVGKELYSKK